jgi:8-oxo-dGTP pyrophosphatase MutT (NUDIX family)
LNEEGEAQLRIEDVLARFAAADVPGRRTAPVDPASSGRVRGDHDLSPELYEPHRPLKAAAVLVPIVDRSQGPQVLLTRRTDHLHDHAGQISFPGGRIDPGDETPEAAALRETEEEIGLPPTKVRLVGRLDTYIVRTGFEVHPVVGLVRPPFDLALDSFEVAEVFEVPLAFFLRPGAKERHSRVFRGRERFFYA